MIKGCKTIAEYAFRQWMTAQGFVDGYFDLKVTGNEGVITDRARETLLLVYDSEERCVSVKKS